MVGGSAAIADALARGVVKHGGKITRRAHVEEILVEGGRAVGVRVRGGRVLRAARGVVSNCDLWSTYKLIPQGACAALDTERSQWERDTKKCGSFMHLHLGIDAAGLPDDLPPQWTVAQDWTLPIDAPGNVIVVSVPSLLDPSLAPPGRHVIHAYTAGNEPYDLWARFDQPPGANAGDEEVRHRGGSRADSREYEAFKEERAACLWAAIEREIPDVRQRARVTLTGSPLTHARFNRRHQGTYGPAIAAGKGSFPGQSTPLPGLYRCGDSTNPGIGVPAVAASGALAANALMPLDQHLRLLDLIRM